MENQQQTETNEERATAIRLSAEIRQEIETVQDVTGAPRHAVLTALSEHVEAGVKGNVFSIYQARVARRAEAAFAMANNSRAKVRAPRSKPATPPTDDVTPAADERID